MQGTIIFDKNYHIKKQFLELFLYMFIILSVFDQSREAFPIPNVLNSMIPLIRDVLILYFFIRNFSKKINSLFVLLPCMLFFMVIIGFLNIHSIKVVKEMWNYLKFFLIYYVFSNEEIFISNRKKFLLFYLRCVLILFIFNVIVVFCFSAFLTRLFSAGLRLTVGNSSIVSYLYISALIIVLYFEVVRHRIIYIVMYILAIVSTVTTTAFVAIIPILFIYFITQLNIKQKVIVLFFTFIVLCVLINVISSISLLSSFLDYLKEKGEQLFELLSFNSDISSVGTLSARELQKRNLLSNMTFMDYIFGLGFSGYNKYIDFMVENQFITFIGLFGLVGVFFVVFILARFFITSIFTVNVYNLTIISVFLCYCYTLVIFLPYASNFVTAFLFALSNFYINTNKNRFYIMRKNI